MAFNPPAKMVELVGNAGASREKLSIFNLLLRGFMAGAYIAIGAALCTMCMTGVVTPGISKLVGGAVFPVGLIAIVLTGMELFTGDCMLVPMAAMMKKVTWGVVMRTWVWVYIGNLLGSLAYAYIMVVGPFVSGQADGTMAVNAFGMTAVGIASGKVLGYKVVGTAGLWSCFVKAIACNFLVNIAILLAITADDVIGKFFAIWFPIMAFVASGFEHCVANMYLLPAGKFLCDWYPEIIAKKGGLLLVNGGITWSDIWLWNLIPATFGNILGGFLFVGVTYFLMFKTEIPAE